VIDVRDINKTFHVPHDVKALVNVSTKIEAGEVVVVCGPSGSGKSTFLRCLNRLEKADNGHIFIDGIDVLDPKTNINKLRAEVGMVFQSFNLFPHKNVFENITLAQKVVRKRSKNDAEVKANALLK
jgi:polar amino acid transport system ATP-binding protein